ncbi:hypothetical protein TH53_08570 [Pedobacter lusitanus]|uniref:Contig32, whole genome shotgun sequence n=1 Tax=Pedobacter lusitanus TaxID=1503925 RepID=A0A0D0GSW4_9SPHI|nr:SusE domain-containing protein [Pedobacter lusitanus]KIO77571.1 hypothetical protein TH53_08570 [Pedobacter lusitanus]
MKSLFIKTMTYSLLLLLFASCKKDETKTVAGNGTAPVLTASQNNLVLSADHAAQTATVLNWSASSFGYSADIAYAVQIDSAGKNFKAPKEVALAGLLTKTFTVAEINDLANQLGLTSGVAGKVEVRVKASISDKYTPAYSNVLALTVTPYLVVINYPSLYVPGSYQGWDPKSAAKISSVNDDKAYEGYVNFPDATTDFKFTSQGDWNGINYGTSTPGILNAGGGDNLHVDGAGYYRIKADTKALTYSLTKTVWAVIGSATGSWDNETLMTYDATAKVWTITKALTAGEFKFRANGSYDINFGDDKGKPKYGGDNIKVAADGNYKITLNLSVPGNYAYSVTKL